MKSQDIFINCPFSKDYRQFFWATIYTVTRSGFIPRCALETDDSSDNRFEKICRIIAQCKYGIHDISKTDLDPKSNLPRFNMPLELGLFLASKRFGNGLQRKKKCIIFDRQQYRYQKFISDISGHDIHSHKNSPKQLIVEIASWLRAETTKQNIPGGTGIASEFPKFQSALINQCAKQSIGEAEITFSDIRLFAQVWIPKMYGFPA